MFDHAPNELASEIVKRLDGVAITAARNALIEAIGLLSSTQVVSATSPLLAKASEETEELSE